MITLVLTMAEKIRIVLKRKGMNLSDLADALEMSRQNLNNKMNRDNFSQEELMSISEVLEVGYESSFIMEDGTKI